jgi:hypothetical protein
MALGFLNKALVAGPPSPEKPPEPDPVPAIVVIIPLGSTLFMTDHP